MAIGTDIVIVEGNSVYIKSNPTIGVLGIGSFVDDASGESGSIQFVKMFRYSINGGIDYTDWASLTTANLNALVFTGEETVVFEMQYQKQQPIGTDQLQVTEVILTESSTIPPPEAPYFSNTIFAQFFGAYDVEVLKWYLNVLAKLYEKGLIPDYIDRFNDQESNKDFIAFWTSVAQFFAFFVIYARTYEKFYESEVLLSEYLEEHGMEVSPENTLTELNFLMENFYQEVFHRGTIHIVDKVENGALVDGELLRLIHYNKEEDEVLFNLYRTEHFGWNLGNSSPLNKSLYLNDNINKSYETGFDIVDLTKYPVVGTASIQQDGNKSTMHIQAGGIGGTSPKYIKVDNRLDYEFSFLIKKTAGEDLNVGVIAYDKDFNQVDMKSYKDGSATNSFLVDASLSRDDKYLLVRLFIYNKDRTPYANDTTEIKQGNDLIFSDDVVWIIPQIQVTSSANLWGIRILPMQTSYSRGFLQVNNFISIWLKNRNHSYSLSEVKEYIKKFLIPYNANVELSDVGSAGGNVTETPPDTFYWVPAGEYCETVGWRPINPVCEVITTEWQPEEETAYCETDENIPGPLTT